MVTMIEFNLYSGARTAINASLITVVQPDNSGNLDESTWISVAGMGDEIHVVEGYHEVLDKIKKANRLWIDANGIKEIQEE